MCEAEEHGEGGDRHSFDLVVPFVYEPEIYGNWLKKARTIGRHSYEFSYDWRRSNIESKCCASPEPFDFTDFLWHTL